MLLTAGWHDTFKTDFRNMPIVGLDVDGIQPVEDIFQRNGFIASMR
jgi:hypothetical protein